MTATTFKERYRDFQELVRELVFVRKHNLTFKPGDPQDTLLLFSEASLVLVALERFLRIIVSDSSDDDTLFNLLERATGKNHRLLQLPGERDVVIRQITDVRNTLLHGNYEQAARQAGCSDVEAYFKEQFASEVEKLYQIVEQLVAQIDITTGRPRTAKS